MKPMPFNVFDARCTSREVLDHVMSRWGALTLVALRPGELRFAEIARAVGGISDRMLSQTLKILEADGFVTRTAPGVRHVEYGVTADGARVADALAGLIDAVYGVMPHVMEGRPGAASSVGAGGHGRAEHREMGPE
ncbi:hypothetical protein GCM10009785_19730 [Brooklawnia cerclae]|uniref:DNA-binding HxlR family transcriptional regulator n=1 Tax=Brooklawnia cerclae TaxID=349934 RepID=A0ABX0SGF3_9ACTN|nr:helix-turn-helix domain-containing protein [Brooklawnia cerclae]NIH57454.1 DNA-binding HxlR family transcriptional regulator [Brooklawnia cerclae]